MEGGPCFPCNVRRGQLNTETLLDCQAQSGPSEFSSAEGPGIWVEGRAQHEQQWNFPRWPRMAFACPGGIGAFHLPGAPAGWG